MFGQFRFKCRKNGSLGYTAIVRLKRDGKRRGSGQPQSARRFDAEDRLADPGSRLDAGCRGRKVWHHPASYQCSVARPYLPLLVGCTGEHRLVPWPTDPHRTRGGLKRNDGDYRPPDAERPHPRTGTQGRVRRRAPSTTPDSGLACIRLSNCIVIGLPVAQTQGLEATSAKDPPAIRISPSGYASTFRNSTWTSMDRQQRKPRRRPRVQTENWAAVRGRPRR
jgi:hypothetical protein